LSVLAAYSFPSNEGPKYIKGISLNIAFQGLGLLLALSMTLYYRMENKRRDKVEGGLPPRGEYVNVIEEHDLAIGKLPTDSRGESDTTNRCNLWQVSDMCLDFAGNARPDVVEDVSFLGILKADLRQVFTCVTAHVYLDF
jgi:hypothetical protein